MYQNNLVKAIGQIVYEATNLKDSGQYRADLIISKVVAPMLSALGWQRKKGLHDGVGYMEIQSDPASVLGVIGGTPQFLFGPVTNSLPFAGTDEAAVLMSYAYNKDTPWLILSDLNRIEILNVLESIKLYPARRSSRFSLRFADLLVNTQEVSNWLSFETVKEGNLAEFDQEIRKTKRVALPVTDRLFDQMRRWRTELIEEIIHSSSLTPNEADILVNRLLNRLLFIRVCEDRGFGEQPSLEAIATHSNLSQSRQELLQKVRMSFRKYSERYNTELFESSEVDSFSFADDTLARIINGLHSPGFPSVKYDFSVIDVDILGAMYEQYVRLRAAWQAPAIISSDALQQSFLPERKTTLVTGGKKAGIYYTPKFIVEHIVQNTVGRWLGDKSPEISNMPSVLDLSCGSGSFLLAAYQKIVDHISSRASGLTKEERHKLLTRCIFGVDRDPRATEIARLNLWLIGLNSPISLPDLSRNIVVGNSLLDPNIQKDATMLQLFFGSEWQQRKPIIWSEAFPNQMATGGFDIIVGNPPYVRIQNMEDQDEKSFYARFFGATKGGFDLSVAFVEMALKLLKSDGLLGLIVSNALLKSNYAERLRERITREGVLRHVVDFGDQLVFPGVRAYTCIIFIKKPGPPLPRATSIFRLTALPALQLLKSEENEVHEKQMVSGTIERKRLSKGPWILMPDREQQLREKLAYGRQKLKDVTKIFQGVKTGLDAAFVLHKRANIEDQGLISAYSELTMKEHLFETALMKPLIKGGHMRRYYLEPSEMILLLPYEGARLIAEDTLCNKYTNAWEYLKKVKDDLASRPKTTKGGWGTGWYAYSRPQNLLLFPKPKLVTPDIAAEASFAHDENGGIYFSGGVAGGYGLLITSSNLVPEFLLGLLNSSLLDWYFQPGAARFQAGYFVYEARFLRNQPIETYYQEDGSPKMNAVEIASLTRELIKANQELRKVVDSLVESAKMIDHIQSLEAQVDEKVFALYDLSANEIDLVKSSPYWAKAKTALAKHLRK